MNDPRQPDEKMHEQREWLRVTLSCIGDAVVTTDPAGRVTFLNPVAESLTGWTQADAHGKPLEAVFKIINQETRRTVESPTVRALRDGVIVGLANHTLLIAKDGTERPIDDSAAPIRNERNEVAGVVLVFRDITERYRQEQTIQDALAYANNIIATLREPFLVINGDLKVHTANRSFYESFRTTPQETEGRFLYDLGNGQWDIPGLRAVLNDVLENHHPVVNYEVEHDFPTIGRRFMMLNAVRVRKPGDHSNLILLAIEDVTQRRQLEQQNAQRGAAALFLASIVNSSDDAIISKSLDGIIQSWNAAAVRMFGYTAEQAVGRPVTLIIPADRAEEEIRILARLRAGERVEHFDTVRVRSDGSAIPVSLIISPIKDESGRVVGASKIASDVTERQRAEEAIRQGEERYRNLFNSMDEGYCIIEMIFDEQQQPVDYRFLEVNAAFEKQSGLHNVTGKRMLEFVSEIEEHWLANYGKVALTGEPIRFANEYKELGSWFDVYAFRVGEPNGRRVAILFNNITHRRQAEEALEISEIRYRRLFEAAKDGILILDTHTGRITDANPFMGELLGYSHDDFKGKELWEIGLFGDKSANEAAVRELQQNGYVRYENLPLESTRGQRVEVEVVANVYQEDHQPVIQCNIRDITERSRLEKKMEEQAEALADLHRRKDEFLAMLSHELRNPLAPIMNAVQLLGLQKNEDQLQRQARSIIERQVGQLTRLVDDLLEVSRITTGRIHLHQERLALNGIVEHAVETVRPLIGQRGHVFKLTLPPQPIWLYADAARLEQVVVNLLTNAAKYTDDGGHILLTVEQEGDEAILRVRDSGVGIAPELLPRIFDLFTQAERSLDRSQGGLGIGLCLVQRLVEMHRGRVEAHSSMGQGSEFVVRLPVVLNLAPLPSPSTDKAKPTGPSLRVLVVDDNVDAAQALKMLLKASGHDVRTVHDGPATLEAVLDYRPNVVLLDIGLPGMNGLEVAKQLRRQPDLGSVVLVAMTGYGQESDRQRSQEAGFDHHLVKPADFGKLHQILATVAEQAS